MANYDERVYGDGGLGGVSSVVSSLPVGFVLGEERKFNGDNYRLVYNAGNSQISPGYVASPVPVSGGPYSVTISTATRTHCHFGLVAVVHATATTGTYFWGMRQGYIASGLVTDATTFTTGCLFYAGTNGTVNGITTNSVAVSGNYAVGYSVIGPTAGTAGVRQASVFLTAP